MRRTAVLCACLALGLAAKAGEAGFATKPTAAKAGDKVRITFAVSAPTDVEVAVLDAQGKVVRHLAAGVLGGQMPPPEPLKAGLAQSVEWDGKDDRGKTVAGGPFKARVRVGTGAKLGRFLGHDPYMWTGIDGLVTDEQGTLYVLAQVLNGQCCVSQTIRAYDRDGKYLRTVFPPPADTPAEKLQGLPQASGADLDAGHLYPANYQPLMPWFFPRSGRVVFLGGRATDGRLTLLAGDALEQICLDGGVPKGSMDLGRLSAAWGEKCAVDRAAGRDMTGAWQGAVLPGGKTALLCGAHSVKKFAETWKNGRIHALSLVEPLTPVDAWGKPGLGLFQMKTFADVDGADQASKTSALAGLDVDGKGNVYVCDRRSGRVVGFDPAGKELGSVKVENPCKVAVHDRTGALYVLAVKAIDRYRSRVEVVKLSGLKDGREVARLTFEKPAQREPQFALDRSSERPAIWVSDVGDYGSLVRLTDNGTALVETLDLRAKQSPESSPVWYCWANPVTDEVFAPDGWGGSRPGNGPVAPGGYIRSFMARFDGETGKRLPCKFSALDMAFDLDGNVYYSGYQSYKTPIWRLTPDLKPLPFPGSDKNEVTGKDIYGKYGWAHCQKGLAVGRDGSIYACTMRTWSDYFVIKWGPDGKYVEGDVVGNVGNVRAGCVKVDGQGNVYLGYPGYPKSHKLPYASPGDWFASSVVKTSPGAPDFGPKAKQPKPAGATDWQGPHSVPWLAGVLNVYPHQAPNGMAARHVSCTCKEARYDLDLYGRLYIPNVLTYRVTVVDNAGNVILKLGHYGNLDSQGAGADSQVKKPDIPLGWPMSVGAAPDHGHVYVGDCINGRVVRADLTWQAEETCAIGGGAGASAPEPAPTVATPVAAAKSDPSDRPEASKVPAPSAEQACQGWFSMARNYRSAGLKDQARRCLNNIIRDYPDSDWAARARGELKNL